MRAGAIYLVQNEERSWTACEESAEWGCVNQWVSGSVGPSFKAYESS